MPDNTLYYGDNLDILRRYPRDETVDLMYLAPSFNFKVTYNVLFAWRFEAKDLASTKQGELEMCATSL